MRLSAVQRCPCAAEDVPLDVGVYGAWFRTASRCTRAAAVARGGLRGWVFHKHLATGLDLSHSSFRRNACEHLLGIPTSVTPRRPTVMVEDQVRAVNEWIRDCQVVWLTFGTVDEAKQFGNQLLAEWLPPLSKR